MTGATGFAGRHVVEALRRVGHLVRVLARDPARAGFPGEVEVVPGDLARAEALAQLVAGADAVLHVAGAIMAVDDAGFFAVNADGTQALVAAAEAAGVPRFVQVSSLAAREPRLSPYGASKRAGEEAVQASALASRAVIIRPPAVYGPGDKATLPLLRALTQHVSVIPSTARSRFSLIHVHDLAEILTAAVTAPRGGVVEVSDGTPGGYGWPEVLAAAEAATGIRVRAVFLPRALPALVGALSEQLARARGVATIVSRGKIAELYHPDWVTHGEGWPLPRSIRFAEGFASTLAWYRAQGWLPPGRGKVRSGPNTPS